MDILDILFDILLKPPQPFIGLFFNDSDRELLDQELTISELQTAIFEMKLNKTPGLDGLPVEFYRTFWSHIG